MSRFTFFTDVLDSLVFEASDASIEAKKKGLTNRGAGNWYDSKGNYVAKTVDGVLQPVQASDKNIDRKIEKEKSDSKDISVSNSKSSNKSKRLESTLKNNKAISKELDDKSADALNIIDDISSSLSSAQLEDIDIIDEDNMFSIIAEGKKQLKFKIQTPGSTEKRRIAAESLYSKLKEKGYDINLSSQGKGVVISNPSGSDIKIDFYKGAGVGKDSSAGGSHAYEALVATSQGMILAGIKPEQISDVLNKIVKDGKIVLKNKNNGSDVSISIDDVAGIGKSWLNNPENLEEAVYKMKKIIENSSSAKLMSSAYDALEEKFGSDWNKKYDIDVSCEGGADTDEFRSDVMIYAVSKDKKEKILIVGNSIKDGNSSQLGQLGTKSVLKAFENGGAAGITQDSKAMSQLNKMGEKARDKFLKQCENIKDSDELSERFNEIFLKSMLDTSNKKNFSKSLHELLTWSFLGTQPPEGLHSMIYQVADQSYEVPAPGTKGSKKLLKNISRLIDDKGFKFVKKGESYILMVGDEPLLKGRNKKEKAEMTHSNRMYIEKTGHLLTDFIK